MSKHLDRAGAKAAIEKVRQDMAAQHPDNLPRLEQLDSHLATAAMVVDHLFDEADRG
jgi:hypothetical protein